MAKLTDSPRMDRTEQIIDELRTTLMREGNLSEDLANRAVNYAVKRTVGIVNKLTDNQALKNQLIEENIPKLKNDAKIWVRNFLKSVSE